MRAPAARPVWVTSSPSPVGGGEDLTGKVSRCRCGRAGCAADPARSPRPSSRRGSRRQVQGVVSRRRQARRRGRQRVDRPTSPMERARGFGAARPDARFARGTRAAELGKLPSAHGSSETHAGWNDDDQPSSAAAAAPSPRPPPAAGASSALQLAHRSSAPHRAALRASGPANAVAFTCRRRRRPDREGITQQVRARRARRGPGAIAETLQSARQPPSGARRG